jgi:glutamate---cysteine ligase / carboxylate-amine ligase
VRPHFSYGTVEVRICDAQTRGDESLALSGLIAACIAQAAIDHSEGALAAPLRQREVEENLWRAIRYGLDGRMIDFGRGEEVPTRAAIEGLMHWAAPAAAEIGVELELPADNGAQRAREAYSQGASLEDFYREAIAETAGTYVPGEAPSPAG